MARGFDIGRQSEVLYNDELFKIHESIKHLTDKVSDPSKGPDTDSDGALWLDRQSGDTQLLYKDSGKWKVVFNDRFRMVGEILSPGQPRDPVTGQLWLNQGVLMYYDGTEWLPAKSVNVDSEFDLAAFEQFLIINPLPIQGGQIYDYSYLIGDFSIWSVGQQYDIGKTVSHNGVYYQCTEAHTSGAMFDMTYWKVLYPIWKPNTSYSINQVVSCGMYYYVCKTAHTSGAVFDGGNWTVIDPELKSQFLLPSVQNDKFFVNGFFVNDYEVKSNVAIQYPTLNLQGKYTSAVHVNPLKITDIVKRVIAVDKNNPVIYVPETNTEYYGIAGGHAGSYGAGQLLLKSNDNSTDYTSVSQGIRLSDKAAEVFDLVLAVSYVYSNTNGSGSLKKKVITLNDQNSIYIGSVSDPICVFVQGMYLHEDVANYTYNSATGYLNIELGSKLDVSVLAFPQKEIGTVATVDTNGKAVVALTKSYNKPIVFAHGETMYSSVPDFSYDSASSKLTIHGAIVGMSYAVVEGEGETDDSHMFVKEGKITAKVDGSLSISCSTLELPEDYEPILFVGGILVSQNDIDRNDDNSLYAYGMIANQDYLLLKDNSGRLIFNNTVSFTTVPTETMDSALVYIENRLVCDASSVITSKLPQRAVGGQVKFLSNEIERNWYKYDAYTSSWLLIDSNLTDNSYLIEALDNSTMQYISSPKSISFLQNFGAKKCVIYSYEYANSIEEPLKVGTIPVNSSNDTYRVGFKHLFSMDKNSLSIYLNGARQYPSIEDSDNYVKEIDNRHFKLPEGVDGTAMYVIEPTEKSETISCTREILNHTNRIKGSTNVYRTKNPLYPGNVRVYISGARQDADKYTILDANTIVFNNPIIGGSEIPIHENDIPPNYVTSETNPIIITERTPEGSYVKVPHSVEDLILIEVRQDYNLKEIVLPVRYQGQKEWSVDGDNLPESILTSRDFVMIYINGFAYGKNYTIDKDRSSIILNDISVTSKLGTDPIMDYFNSNPDIYIKWQKNNGYKPYVPKEIKDKLIIEWR